jgi:hypothetical protein
MVFQSMPSTILITASDREPASQLGPQHTIPNPLENNQSPNRLVWWEEIYSTLFEVHFHHDKGDEMSKSPVVGDAFRCIFNCCS